MCSRTLPPTKEKRIEGAPSIRFFFVGGKVRLHVGYKNSFELFSILRNSQCESDFSICREHDA